MNRENNSKLNWTSKTVWGAVGRTHLATVEVAGQTWNFVVDQPSKGYWVARAWCDQELCLYRDGTTMKSMKNLCEDYLARKALASATDALRHTAETLTGPKMADAMKSATDALREFTVMACSGLRPICSCPSPTHRMNCGVGAKPVVVSA